MPDLTDRICEAIKELTAHRASRAYAAQWISRAEIERHLGVDDASLQTAVR
jgi:hypothetical protein